jgi:Ca2+-binding EF-hand superfamily protein
MGSATDQHTILLNKNLLGGNIQNVIKKLAMRLEEKYFSSISAF